ncbi:phage tail protein [Burkholderia sp. LMU1-1-1.1]|uniref:phage tail protein n=1 Tax=Burkholderia sp. LMU1-1-1.1 TaxID=3135266 RepID=UPI0034360C4E
MNLIDFASDGCDGVWALALPACGDGPPCCIHIDCAGYEVGRFTIDDASAPIQLAWLARAERLFVLAAGGKRLNAYAPGLSKPMFVVDIDRVRPCFAVTFLGSDVRSRLVLAGLEHSAWGGGATVLTLDADGQALHTLPLPAPATGIHATADALLVTTMDGLLRYPLDASAGGASESRCDFITPVLQSPVNENPRRWLRVEALAKLPPGSSMEISYAATSDPQVQEQAARIAADRSLTAGQRLARLREYLPAWHAPIVFQGADTDTDGPLAVPLFDVHEPWLWVSVTLVAAPASALPRLTRLDVLYPGLTLMEYLPQVYQRAEAEPDNFLRALVGVLETGTQEQDQRIAAMGSMIAPDTAPAEWLDYLARWLDLPWDDALEVDQKRRLLASADSLAGSRGTRAGLEALLAALLPGTPPPYRIVDRSAQYGFMALGGTTLPALLAGLPASAMALNRKAILGRGRLTCPAAPPDDTAWLTGQVRIAVTATAAQRAAWEPWLAALVGAMLPATVRLVLEWRSVAARRLDDRLVDGYVLNEAPAPHLGTDAVTGLARLGGTGGPELR